MSERPSRGSFRRRGPRQKPNDDDAPDDNGAEPFTTQLRGPQSLERLRTRVEAAASELRRLREENTALAARLAKLESQPRLPESEEGTVIQLEEDPEALRRKVASFIEAIDAYLEAHKRS